MLQCILDFDKLAFRVGGYSMNDAKDFENEEALRDFLLDIECLDELLPWTQRVNLFDGY